MALFYASGSRQNDKGKFHQSRRPGLQHDEKHQHGEFRFELLSIESTAPIKRRRYHVRILTKRNLRVAFLRDFLSPQQALAAAREWVAERELAQRNKF